MAPMGQFVGEAEALTEDPLSEPDMCCGGVTDEDVASLLPSASTGTTTAEKSLGSQPTDAWPPFA
jgi:hypothetical protein